MGSYNFNRIATGVLLASFIVLLVSNVVDLVYNPGKHDEPRGYTVDITTTTASTSQEGEPTVVLDISELIANASVERGKTVSKKCAACHTFDKGGPDRVGPNLWGIIGAKKCRNANFTYSKALLSKGGNWEEATLFEFLKSPQSYASGTRMSFAGLSKPQDIADLLAYFKSLE